MRGGGGDPQCGARVTPTHGNGPVLALSTLLYYCLIAPLAALTAGGGGLTGDSVSNIKVYIV